MPRSHRFDALAVSPKGIELMAPSNRFDEIRSVCEPDHPNQQGHANPQKTYSRKTTSISNTI